MKLEYYKILVEDWRARLSPLCERIEPAGSVLREKPEPRDLELVCIPKIVTKSDLFGDKKIDLLEAWFAEHNDGSLFYFNKNGSRYKKLTLKEQNAKLDLFIVRPPAQWGVIFAIRTGPENYSHWFVTSKQQRGGCPSYLRVKDGHVEHRDSGKVYSTPEEKDFFDLLGIPYQEPRLRGTGVG